MPHNKNQSNRAFALVITSSPKAEWLILNPAGSSEWCFETKIKKYEIYTHQGNPGSSQWCWNIFKTLLGWEFISKFIIIIIIVITVIIILSEVHHLFKLGSHNITHIGLRAEGAKANITGSIYLTISIYNLSQQLYSLCSNHFIGQLWPIMFLQSRWYTSIFVSLVFYFDLRNTLAQTKLRMLLGAGCRGWRCSWVTLK